MTPGYFNAMGIAVTRGRGFTEEDRADGHLVAVVNETAARRYWPGEDPVGKRIAIGSSERFGSFRQVRPGEVEWREIVGVVADVRSAGFAASVQPEVFHSYKQFPLYDPSLIVRTAGDPAALTQSIRSEIAAVNPARRRHARADARRRGEPDDRGSQAARHARHDVLDARAAAGHARHLRRDVVHRHAADA